MEDERTPIPVDDDTWLEPVEGDDDAADLVDVRGDRWRLRRGRPSPSMSLTLALLLVAIAAAVIAYAVA